MVLVRLLVVLALQEGILARSEVQFTFRNGVESTAKAVSLFAKEVGVSVGDRSEYV